MKYLDSYKLFEGRGVELKARLDEIEEEQKQIRQDTENSLIEVQRKLGINYIPIKSEEHGVWVSVEDRHGETYSELNVYITKIYAKTGKFEGYEEGNREAYFVESISKIDSVDLLEILVDIEEEPIEYFAIAAIQSAINVEEYSYIGLDVIRKLLKRVKNIEYEHNDETFLETETTDDGDIFLSSFEFQDIFLNKWPEKFTLLKDNVMNINQKIYDKYPHIAEGEAIGFFSTKEG